VTLYPSLSVKYDTVIRSSPRLTLGWLGDTRSLVSSLNTEHPDAKNS
jgi:hypothetical protein